MDKKIAENLKNRLDSHDKLWYPVVTARLVKSNQSSSDSSEEMPATLFAEIRFLHSILLFIKKHKRLHLFFIIHLVADTNHEFIVIVIGNIACRH